jgi:hypothetical protein
MTYVVLYADLSGLSPADADDFADAAADLDLDVDDLSPRLGAGQEVVTVLLSSTLAEVAAKLAGKVGSDAGAKLLDLLQKLWRRHSGPAAIEDRQHRVSFIWDDKDQRDGLLAANELIRIWDNLGVIRDGTVLAWDSAARRWQEMSGKARKAPKAEKQ